jgi:DNA topoisomerase-1
MRSRRIKEDKERLEKPYVFALVDGRKEKTGNFRAEPPGLFRGRGEHPKKGALKVNRIHHVGRVVETS